MSLRALCLAVHLLFGTPAWAAGDAPEPTVTQGIMQSLFDPMTKVLGASFDDAAFTAATNRPGIAAELAKLSRNAAALEAHGKTQDRAFEFVTKSLGRDARRLEMYYGKQRFDEARFVLHHMTDNCIACHSTLPEGRKFPGSDAFFTKVNGETLQPLERATLQLVSRRFDDALSTFETIFKSKDVDPALLTTLGSFTDYLRVSISVKSDFKRPQPVLAGLIAEASTPIHVKAQLERWLKTLKDFDARGVLAAGDLAAAKRIMDQGHEFMQFLRDRDGMIHYLTAEAILTRFIRGHPDRGAEVAEAYYLLGICTSMTEHSFWISRSDFFLESAIRLAPGASFAPKAYATLEENLMASYTGSGGTRVPQDVRDLLGELKRIIRQEPGKI